MTDKKQTSDGAQDLLYQQLDKRLKKFRDIPGGLIPALHSAQELFGYLPRKTLQCISEAMDIPLSEIYGVVSFYSFFSTKPSGRYTIRVCMGTACYVRGADKVLAEISRRLGIEIGQTTPDGMYTLNASRCFGACGLAPVVTINGEVFQKVSVESVGPMLEQFGTDDKIAQGA